MILLLLCSHVHTGSLNLTSILALVHTWHKYTCGGPIHSIWGHPRCNPVPASGNRMLQVPPTPHSEWRELGPQIDLGRTSLLSFLSLPNSLHFSILFSLSGWLSVIWTSQSCLTTTSTTHYKEIPSLQTTLNDGQRCTLLWLLVGVW